jgi:hypothetical protein
MTMTNLQEELKHHKPHKMEDGDPKSISIAAGTSSIHTPTPRGGHKYMPNKWRRSNGNAKQENCQPHSKGIIQCSLNCYDASRLISKISMPVAAERHMCHCKHCRCRSHKTEKGKPHGAILEEKKKRKRGHTSYVSIEGPHNYFGFT